ncbi:unnamed protein product [Mytilus edulis]|uniref:Ubiquitin-like protease family profile domain-containing protein n=1 Tax=Mytilus edulis TaxID=6550 RepID=A0A8S3QTA3_MYTED|nr:unnamed protein product [Mytilus edulis]
MKYERIRKNEVREDRIMLAVIKERSKGIIICITLIVKNDYLFKAFLETIWDSWKGNADEKFGTVYGNVLYVSDLMSLKIEEELNDQIINLYCSVLQKRTDQCVQDDIQQYDTVIGCINDGKCHWVAVVMDVQHHIVTIMDPLKISKKLRTYEKNFNYFTKSRDLGTWTICTAVGYPLQNDFSSCGVYCLKFLDRYLSKTDTSLELNVQAERFTIGSEIVQAVQTKGAIMTCFLCAKEPTNMKKLDIQREEKKEQQQKSIQILDENGIKFETMKEREKEEEQKSSENVDESENLRQSKKEKKEEEQKSSENVDESENLRQSKKDKKKKNRKFETIKERQKEEEQKSSENVDESENLRQSKKDKKKKNRKFETIKERQKEEEQKSSENVDQSENLRQSKKDKKKKNRKFETIKERQKEEEQKSSENVDESGIECEKFEEGEKEEQKSTENEDESGLKCKPIEEKEKKNKNRSSEQHIEFGYLWPPYDDIECVYLPLKSLENVDEKGDVDYQVQSLNTLTEALVDKEATKKAVCKKMKGTSAQKRVTLKKLSKEMSYNNKNAVLTYICREIVGHVIAEINKTNVNKAMHGKVLRPFWETIQTMLPGNDLLDT